MIKELFLKNRIVKNASWIVACKIGQSVLSLIVTMFVARYLGPSNYGVINYAASIVAFVVPIVQLGLGNIQVQEFVENPADEGKILGTTLLLSGLSAVAGIAGVISFAVIANDGEFETIIVCALYSTILFFQGAELIQFWFQTKYISKYASIVSIIAFAVVSLYKIFLLVSGKSVLWFAVANPIDYVLILLALVFVYKKLGGASLSFSFDVAKRMISKSKYYIIANLMVVVFTQTDRVMLKMMLDSSATGFYSAASTCAQLSNFVFAAIIDSARPTIFEKHKVSKTEFGNSVTLLYSVIIYSTLAFCLLITLFAGPIISVIYGEQYISSVDVLRVIVWFLPFSFIGSVRNIWLLAENKQKWIPVINLSGAFANVGMNLILIPLWGMVGAGVASLVTQCFSNVFVGYIIRDTRENNRLMVRGLDVRLFIKYLNCRSMKR